jgi:uncharacterized membrane protein YraQ (UPF0718 family)
MAEAVAEARTSTRNALEVALVLGVGTATLWGVGNLSIPEVSNFLLVFGSLLVEAVPFILLGAIVSAAIEVFVPGRYFERLARLPGTLQLPASGLAGFAFPVCECGSVPVARRLAQKGLSPASAITFMLAAPIVNPVVIASTFVAYRGRESLWPMVLGRTSLGLLCAIAVGWVVGSRRSDLVPAADADDLDHAHGGRQASFFGHLAGDFVFMGRYLVVGAAVAAALQTFVPQSIIGSIAGTPVIDLLAMMGLAFLLSLCSESDAFVAASFVQFGVGAQLAFLVFGPLLDTKLTFLYSGTFNTRLLRTIALVVGAVTLAGTLWLEVIFG